MSIFRAVRPESLRDSMERLLAAPGRRRTVLGVVVAIGGSALATAIASIPSHRGTAVPALLYLLIVVAAAAIGHLWPSLLAAALSFIELDYRPGPHVRGEQGRGPVRPRRLSGGCRGRQRGHLSRPGAASQGGVP